MEPEKINEQEQSVKSQAIHQNGHLLPETKEVDNFEQNGLQQALTPSDATSDDERHCLEMFRLAALQGDQRARSWIQRRYHTLVLNWMHQHPRRKDACRLKREGSYVKQAFEGFWQTAADQSLQFSTLAVALRYLQASLNTVVLETLRANSHPEKVIPANRTFAPGLNQEEFEDSRALWESMRHTLSNEREQRMAYLLFHCGLKPRQIVSYCPQEFNDAQEIYRLERTILERFLQS